MLTLINLILTILICFRVFKYNNFVIIEQNFKGQVFNNKKDFKNEHK